MNGEQETPETLRRQMEETGGSQSMEQPPGGSSPQGGSSAPLSQTGAAPSVVVPENLKSLVEEIIEEAQTREVPTVEEQSRRLNLIGQCIVRGLSKAKGRILNHGNKPDSYLYFEANVVFEVARQARCDYGIVRLPNNKGYERTIEQGEVETISWENGKKIKGKTFGPVTIYYAEAFASCPILGSSVGLTGAGVGVFVTSEDKFLKGTKRSAGVWGHERNMMQAAQTRAMRKALVRILGLDAINEAALAQILGVKIEDAKKRITAINFKGDGED